MIDRIFSFELNRQAKYLWYLDISGCKVSTLCFLNELNSFEVLILEQCGNLIDADFLAIENCRTVEQLYLGFTQTTADTIIKLSRPKLSCIEAVGTRTTVGQ